MRVFGFALKLVCVHLTLVLLSSAEASPRTSEFKGWAAVSRELSTRLAPTGRPLKMDQFIPAAGLDALLGTWFTFGSEHSFRNGLPNSVNVLIWHVALSGFARTMGDSCLAPKLDFNSRFAAVLARVCAWPSPEASGDDVMLDFWLSLMGYNAPAEEFTAWRDFMRASSFRERPANEAIEAMTLSLTMNPYFLLHR